MILSILYTLLFFFAIIIDINQCSDDCFYQPGHPGKRCYHSSDHTKYSCCPLSERCDNGECRPSGSTKSPKSISRDTYLYIGIGLGVFSIVCLALGIVYWRYKEQNTPQNKSNFVTSFSTPQRTTGSAGVRIRSSTSGENSIKLQTFSTNIPADDKP